MLRSLNRIGNTFVKWLLLSPFHGLISKKVMLITVTGRKSGKRYTTPVEYARDGETVFATSTAGRTWWKNLEGGSPAQARIAGRDYEGTGNVSTDPAVLESAVNQLYPRMSEAQRSRFRNGRIAITLHLK